MTISDARKRLEQLDPEVRDSMASLFRASVLASARAIDLKRIVSEKTADDLTRSLTTTADHNPGSHRL